MSSETSLGGHSHAPLSTTRTDGWWVEPLLYFLGLSAFLVYATWRAVFAGNWYFVGAVEGFGGYVSPFFSPPVFIKDPGILGHAPLHHAWFGGSPHVANLPQGEKIPVSARILTICDAYDAMMEARSAELDGDEEAAVDAWCQVFGEAFRTLSEPEEDD